MSVNSFVPSLPGAPSLTEALELSSPVDELIVYTAQASYTWLADMEESFNRAGTLRARVGLDLLPQASALLRLREHSLQEGRDIALIRTTAMSIFHPKIYVARRGASIRAVVGSSNGSRPGFSTNVEANVLLAGEEGSSEARLVRSLLRDIDTAIENQVVSGASRLVRLPDDPLPIVKPNAARRSLLEPEAAESLATDGWSNDPGYLDSALVAEFDAPMTGMIRTVERSMGAPTGGQGGFDIGNTSLPAVRQVLDQYGSNLELAWRFITGGGATIFAVNEPPRSNGVRLSGTTGNHAVITVTMALVARPAYMQLKAINATKGYAHVTYRLEVRPSPEVPRLWMMHVVPDANAVFGDGEVLE